MGANHSSKINEVQPFVQELPEKNYVAVQLVEDGDYTTYQDMKQLPISLLNRSDSKFIGSNLLDSVTNMLDIKRSDHIILVPTGGKVAHQFEILVQFRLNGFTNSQLLIGSTRDLPQQDLTGQFEYCLDKSKVADFDKVQSMVQNKEAAQIIETRPTPFLAVGKIQGSTHLSCNDLVNSDGSAKTPVEVRDILTSKGVDLNKEVVISCGWGITVCVLYNQVKNLSEIKSCIYDGSWAEYSNRSNQSWLNSFK